MLSNVCVIVPVYSDKLQRSELLSFRNTCRVLCKYPIVLIAPDSLCVNIYKQEAASVGCTVGVQRFSDAFFKSVRTYNALCLSHTLYERFMQYDYMLICQLDAWVFSDQLEYWCQQAYDYIGGIWPAKSDCNTFNYHIAGNGGLSLRRVCAMLRAIEQMDREKISIPMRCKRIVQSFLWHQRHYERKGEKGIGTYLKSIRQAIRLSKIGLADRPNIQEDVFFAVSCSKAGVPLSVPMGNSALTFSWECEPRIMYSLNKQQLPFGCHAFERYDAAFWKEFIPF